MGSFDPLSAAFDLGKTAIERIWPDPIRRAEELRKLEELRQAGDLAKLNAHVQLMLGQLEVNKAEAQHKSIFVAGWRPAIGWVGAISLALIYIPKAIVMTLIWTYQCYLILHAVPDAISLNDVSKVVLPAFPDLGVSDILGLLGSMLGIGAMRSHDKRHKVQTDSLGEQS